MKFNKKVDKKSLMIKAVVGDKNTAGLKDNVITFSFKAKDPIAMSLFTREFSKTLLKFKDRQITFDLSSFLKNYHVECKFLLAATLLNKIDTFVEPCYSLKAKKSTNEVNVLYSKADAQIVNKVLPIVKCMHIARDYQLMPANILTTARFVAEIKKVVKQLKLTNLKVKVLTSKDIKKENMGLLEAVNKGSDEPAAMVVLEYLNNKQNKDILAYVGKGIMYDAGGYELKPNKFMEGMNQDMTGAAVVLGAMLSLAISKEKANVVGFLPLAKNMVSSRSMVVTDVYKACNGMTVEVTSPDSEGRMIVADAVAYANKHYAVSKVFTIATLTGLTSIAFGDYLTPYWATKGETSHNIHIAADIVGDYVLSLPLFPEYFDTVRKSSKIADVANGAPKREASNGVAAAFLKTFCKCDDFAHFDIAGSNEFHKYPVTPLGLMLFAFAVAHFNKK